MKKKSLVIPALSSLLLSTAILASTTAYAEETTEPAVVTSNTGAEPTTSNAVSAETPVSNDVTGEELPVFDKEVVILHTNDIHGRIEENAKARTPVIGLAKLDGVVKEEKAKTDQLTLLLDAGDAFQGLPISNSSKGLDMLEIMNNMDFDAMAVGNHEFDFDLTTVNTYKEKLKFPLLSVNTYVNNVRLFEASTIIDKDKTVKGDEFVVIGVTTPETYTKTHPKNVVGVEFRDPITEVNNAIAEIEAKAKAENVVYNNYVILAHMGIDATTPEEWKGSTLAKALDANPLLADKKVILIDGHSHTVHTDKFGHVVYNQTGSYLENIGKIRLSKDGAIDAQNLSYKDVKDVIPTEKISKMVANVKAKFDADNAVVVIENNPVKLEGNRNHVRVRETNLGNAIADSLYEYGQTGFSHKTDIAVTNGGGIRETIKENAPVTKGDIIAVLPFGNIISQIQLTGQQVKEMFMKSFSSPLQLNKETGKTVLDERGLPLLEPNGPFLHTAGVKVFYDTTKDANERVLSIQVLNKETGQYEPLDLEKTYYLATNDFLAAGGDGYKMLNGAREEGPSMDEVFAEYLKKVDLLTYKEINPNKRLVAINEKDYKALYPKQQGDVKHVEVSKNPPTYELPTYVLPQPEGILLEEPKEVATPEMKEEKKAMPLSTASVSSASQAKATLPKTGDAGSVFAVIGGLFSFIGAGFITKSKKD